MDQIFLFLPELLGLDPQAFTLYLVMLVTISNVAAKLIPESTVGWLGVVRKICAFIGVNLSNRITPNVTSKDINKALAAGVPDSVIKASADQLPEAVEIGRGATDFAESIVLAGDSRLPDGMGRE